MSTNLFYEYLSSLAEDKDFTNGKAFSKAFQFNKKGFNLGCKNLYDRPINYENLRPEIPRQLKELERRGFYGYEPNSKNKNLNQEIIILKLKLIKFEEYCQFFKLEPFDSIYNILYKSLSLGPSYADELKDFFAYSLRASIGIDFTPPPGQKIMIFEDICQIYPPKHLINWMRPKDISDMLDYCQQEPNIKIDKDLKEFIKKFLKKDENLIFEDHLHHIENMKEKSSFKKGISQMQEKLDKGLKTFYPTHLEFRITSVHKTACESRTIAIAESSARDFISIVRSNYKKVLNNPNDMYGERPYKTEQHLHQEYEKLFFLFDQKKSGWTFPMELITIFFEALCDIYPDFYPFIEMKNIFSSKSVTYTLEELPNVKPKRGFTLGMFDDIVSFLISCLWDKFLEEEIHGYLKDYIDNLSGFFFGDDSMIIAKEIPTHDFKSICKMWSTYIDNYGICLNSKKSFLTNVGVFCEIYGRHSQKKLLKKLEYMLSVYDCLKCYNTYHAKLVFSSLDLVLKTMLTYDGESKKGHSYLEESLRMMQDDIINSFDYEFFDAEFRLHFQCGGWYYYMEEGQNTFLYEVYEGDIHPSFINIALINPDDYLGKNQQKKNKPIVEKFSNMQFYADLTGYFSLDTGINMYRILINRIKRDSISIAKDYWDIEFARKKAYLSTKYTDMNNRLLLMKRFFKENQKLSEKMFTKAYWNVPLWYDFTKNDFISCKKHPKKLDKTRSLDFVRNFPEKVSNIYNTRYLKEISWKDIYSNIDYSLATSKWIIPTEWAVFANNLNIDIEYLYKKMSKFGYNLFEYIPASLGQKDSWQLEKIFKLNEEFLFYDPNICTYITITESELTTLCYSEDIFEYAYKNILKERYDISDGDYDYLSNFIYNDDIRCHPDKFIEENQEPTYEEFLIEQNIVIISPKNKMFEEEKKELIYVPSNVKLITNFEDIEDDDWESDDKNSDNNSNSSQQYDIHEYNEYDMYAELNNLDGNYQHESSSDGDSDYG